MKINADLKMEPDESRKMVYDLITGRIMRHDPWKVDADKNYIMPSIKEIEAIFGVSGEAIKETTIFFEECGGDVGKLIHLLNDHCRDEMFFIDRGTLFDSSRWYTNEYYFYFIMFTKKLMGDYNWRFMKGENEQLSKYHKIYEIGHLRHIPYGYGSDKDSSSAIQKAIFKCYENQGFGSDEFFNWIDLLTAEKTPISFKEEITKLENYWLCNEFCYFLFEFGKVILNNNSMVSIASESFEYFDLAGFSYVPESMLLKILCFICNKTTSLYDIKVDQNSKNATNLSFHISKRYVRKEDIYEFSAFEMNHSLTIVSFPQILKKLFKLSGLPEVINLSGWCTEYLSFTLKWEERILSIPYFQLLVLNVSAVALSLLNSIFRLGMLLPIALFCLHANIILVFLRALKILRNKKDIAEGHAIKTNEDNKKRLEKSEELSTELIREKEELEKKVLERTKELARMNEKLKEADNSKTEFFANVTHEFRTPLTLIIGPLDTIITESKVNNEKLKTIKYNAMKLLRLINSLLDLTKMDSRKMRVQNRSVDIVKSLEFYVASIKSTAEIRGLDLLFQNNASRTGTDRDSCIVSLDADLFEKAVFNLISNSLKFTPEGGKIIVQLDVDKSAFSVSVKDTGIGIPEDRLQEVFERFSQIDGSASRIHEGTGIGLALTKEIVQLLGGSISVNSIVGKGSVFTIKLPYEKNDYLLEKSVMNLPADWACSFINGISKSEISLSDSIAGNSSKNKKILVVEDNIDMQKYIQTILGADYDLSFAKNGKEGTEKAISKKPDLILSDVMMPVMDGYRMTEIIKSNDETRGIPVILLTAKSEIFMKIEGFEKGADDYIIKPFNNEELLARIRAHLEIKSLRDKTIMQKEELEKTLKERLFFLKQLEESEKTFREMADNLPVAIVESDLEYEIKYHNKYATQLLEISLNSNFLDFFVKDINEKYFQRIQEIGETGNSEFHECTMKRANGNSLIVLIKSIMIYDRGEPKSIRSTIIEIAPYFNKLLMPGKDFCMKYRITERETEIIILLIKGLSYKLIADKLFISYKTVNNHITNIYQKTEVNSRNQLVELIQKY